MSVALHDHHLNHRGVWLVGWLALLLCFAVLLRMTILHDTIRVFKLLIVEYINVHTPTTTTIVLPCHSMGGGCRSYVVLHQVSQEMRVE